jgi:hypothetical protein
MTDVQIQYRMRLLYIDCLIEYVVEAEAMSAFKLKLS